MGLYNEFPYIVFASFLCLLSFEKESRCQAFFKKRAKNLQNGSAEMIKLYVVKKYYLLYNTRRGEIMTIIVCVDDKMGMTFNKRRQSRDSAVTEKIVEMSCDTRLLMNSYSAKLFENAEVIVSENFLKEAESNDFCFVENIDVSEYKEKIEKVVLFKWNRAYPSDVKLSIDFNSFTLKESFDFVGTSHDNITCEVWEK